MLKVLEGKKTAIGAGIVALVGIAGYLGGVATDLQALMLIGFAMTAFGLGDKVQRFAPQILAELRELKSVQQQIAAGKKVDLAAEITNATEIAMRGAAGK